MTMLDQLLDPTQNLVTLTKHLQGTSTTLQTQTPSSAEVSTSLRWKLKFCTLSRTASSRHHKVNIIENLVMYNLTHNIIFNCYVLLYYIAYDWETLLKVPNGRP